MRKFHEAESYRAAERHAKDVGNAANRPYLYAAGGRGGRGG